MNSEAQRARNKRKRDKLRAKRRAVESASSVFRFRIDGYASHFLYQCGLMPRQYKHCLCTNVYRQGKDCTELHEIEWSTEWVYSTTHDLSSSTLDAIEAFVNTSKEVEHTVWKVVMTCQVCGVERRKVWQGHTNAAELAAEVCLLVKQLSSR